MTTENSAPAGLLEKVTLRIPGNPEFLHLLRSVVTSVAARQNLSFDEIDDVQLVVYEAGAYLLRLEAPHVWLAVSRSGTGIAAEVWVEASVEAWPQQKDADSLSWTVMKALTDSVEFVRREGWPGIAFTKGSGGAEADGG